MIYDSGERQLIQDEYNKIGWGGVAFELTPWVIYSTVIAKQGATGSLEFFREPVSQDHSFMWTNLYLPGMLPNPQSFVIRTIRIFGVSTDMAFSAFRFFVGNKIYLETPAWIHSVRAGMVLDPPIMIPTQYYFGARLSWDGKLQLGRGFGGRRLGDKAIQVAFVGKLARPLQ